MVVLWQVASTARKKSTSGVASFGYILERVGDNLRVVSLAQEAGLSLTHMAMAFVMAHPAVTSALLGPRTMEHLDDLLAGAEVRLGEDILDRIDQIVPPGAEVGLNEANYTLAKQTLRRRPADERAAA